MNLTTYVHLVPKLRISGVAFLLPHTFSERGREQFYFINLKDTDPLIHVSTDSLYSDAVSMAAVKSR